MHGYYYDARSTMKCTGGSISVDWITIQTEKDGVVESHQYRHKYGELTLMFMNWLSKNIYDEVDDTIIEGWLLAFLLEEQ